MAALVAFNDTIVALVSPDEVWAFRASDGERVWQRSLGGQTASAALAVDGGRVFV
jgi:outer membrane protein assembly factor BamB